MHWSRELEVQRWRAWWDNTQPQLASLTGDSVLHAGRNRVLAVAGPQGRPVVIKHFRVRKAFQKLVYRFRASKAQRAYAYAQRLLSLGFATPAPLAWGERREGKTLCEAWLITAQSSAPGTARELERGTFPDVSSHPQRVASAYRAIGALVARLHQAGVIHRDLTSGNLLLTPQGNDWHIELIDINRMSFGAPISWRKGLPNLVSLGVQGENRTALLAGYAAGFAIDIILCQGRYDRLLAAHRRKWAFKNATRPWRRKIGL